MQTLIDLCITNFPDKITASGTFSLGISDHSLVYLVRKSSYPKWQINKPVIRRDFKQFKEANFLYDLNELNFDEASHCENPNEMWYNWANKLTLVINKHAPFKKKRLGKKKSPWITPEVVSKMRQRDSLKKKFDITKDEHIWNQYKKLVTKPTISLSNQNVTILHLILKLQVTTLKKLGSLLTN